MYLKGNWSRKPRSIAMLLATSCQDSKISQELEGMLEEWKTFKNLASYLDSSQDLAMFYFT